MTERYGPEDAGIPAWEAPTGAPLPSASGYSSGGFSSPPSAPPPASAPGVPGVPTYRSWQPGFMPLRPLALGDFLNLPMKAIGFNRQVLLGGPLLCILASMLAFILASVLFVVDQQDYLSDYFFYFPNGELGPISGEVIAALIVAVLFSLVTDAAARAFVVPGVSRAILGEKLSLGGAWAVARPRILQILLLYLLVTLLAVGAILLLVVISVGAPGLGVLLILGLIPVSFYLAVFIGVAVSAIVLERISAPAALSRASTLMKQNAWRLIGNFLVIGIVVYILSAIVSQVGSVAIIGFASSSLGTILLATVIFTLISTVFSSLIQYSFLGTIFTLIYVDLRIRKEGFDLDLARAAEARVGR